MFRKMLNWIRSQLNQIFGAPIATDDVAISSRMESALELWVQIYESGGPWCGGKTGLHSLDIGGGIAREFARLVLLELNMEVSGSARADYISAQLVPFLDRLQTNVEIACAFGGMLFKPYPGGGRLIIDAVQADAIVPTAFDADGRLTGCIIPQQIKRANRIYTRLEYHDYNAAARREDIHNRAFSSATAQQLGAPVALSEVAEWADLAPDAQFEGLDRPSFAYFRIPSANREDRHSPMGMSVYAPAVDTIRDADTQYGSLIWEYRGGELAIDVDESALRRDADGNLALDERERRLYRSHLYTGVGKPLYQAFAPALRDESYRTGLDAILKRIEFQCGLAYGTLSDPQSVEKTAEEVRASKQRSYATVRSIQHALQGALDDLVYVMDYLASAYQLAPAGQVVATYDWDDSLVNDPNDRRTRFWSYVTAGKFPFAQYLQEYEHYTPEDAQAAVAAARAENQSSEPLSFGGF